MSKETWIYFFILSIQKDEAFNLNQFFIIRKRTDERQVKKDVDKSFDKGITTTSCTSPVFFLGCLFVALIGIIIHY